MALQLHQRGWQLGQLVACPCWGSALCAFWRTAGVARVSALVALWASPFHAMLLHLPGVQACFWCTLEQHEHTCKESSSAGFQATLSPWF